jgi:RNA polymerase sigma-70 factor (ECF subfamily)
MSQITPQTICAAVKQSPIAVQEIHKYMLPLLTRYFARRVNDLYDQEELIQDTIISVYDSLPRFEGRASFRTWMYRIAHHELVDYYRRKKIKAIVFSKLPFLQEIVDKALGPQLQLEEIEAKQRVVNTLLGLNEGYAQILRLRYIEGFSVSVIAEKLHITYKAAESKLSRARVAFSKAYTTSV